MREEGATSFVEMVRAGRVPHPTQKQFDVNDWHEAYNTTQKLARDEGLYNAGLWFAETLQKLWSDIDAVGLAEHKRSALIAGFCGAANHQYLFIHSAIKKWFEISTDASQPVTSAMDVPIALNSGNLARPDTVLTAIGDTLGTALQYVFTPNPIRPQMRAKASAILNYETLFRVLSNITACNIFWRRVLWENYEFSVADGGVMLAPSADYLSKSWAVSEWRRMIEAQNFGIAYHSVWKAGKIVIPKPLGVKLVRRFGRTISFDPRYLTPEGDVLPESEVLRLMVEHGYGRWILGSDLPISQQCSITVAELLDAFQVMHGIFQCIGREIERTDLSHRPLSSFCVPIRRKAVEDVLVRALDWDRRKAEAVVGFFTYRGRALDGIWSKPLIETSPYMVVPTLISILDSNPARSLELWLSEAGAEDVLRNRGSDFERHIRRRIGKELARPMFAAHSSMLASDWAPKIDGARRDIDLIFRVGRSVFVAELKLKKHPTLPQEIRRYIDELHHAARQLAARVSYLKRNLDAVANKLAYSESPDRLNVYGFILTALPFGCGAMIDGFPVIDQECLIEFFDPGYFAIRTEMGADLNFVPERLLPFYSSLDEAEVALPYYLRWPVRARFFESYIQEKEHRVFDFAGSTQTLCYKEWIVQLPPMDAAHADTMHESLVAAWQRELEGLDLDGL